MFRQVTEDTRAKKAQCDVYYFTPEGNKLVDKYLILLSILERIALNISNFRVTLIMLDIKTKKNNKYS